MFLLTDERKDMIAMQTIPRLVAGLREAVAAHIETEVRERLREAVGRAFGGARAPGPTASRKDGRRKGPLQLCPAPRCRNPAAPVFGMLCRDHKDAPKKIVNAWRAARRARKAAGR